MNITVNEILSNKSNMMNLKMRKAPAIVSDQPMPKPIGTENVAFGKSANIAKVAKKAAVPAALALAALFASCQYSEQYVDMDDSKLMEKMDKIIELLQAAKAAGESTNATVLAWYAEYQAGKMSYEQFTTNVEALLRNIDKTVSHIDSTLTDHANKFDQFVNKYNEDQVNLNLRFDNFEKDDSASIAEAIAIKNAIADIKIDINGVHLNGDSIYTLLKDNNSQLMDSLAVWLNNNNGAGSSDVTNNSLQTMLDNFFANLKIDLEALKNSEVADIDSIISNKWNEYKQMDAEKVANYDAKYDSLMAKLDGMFGRLGDIDQNILNVGANLAGKVDTVNLNITNFANSYKAGNDSIAALIKEFRNASTERQDTIIAKIKALENSTKAGLDSLKSTAKDAAADLAEMRDSIAPALDLLRELRDNGNNNYQNFLQVLAERDSANQTNFFNTFNITMQALGLDSIAQNVKDIKTVENAINDKMDGVQNIFNFISNLNYDDLDADVIAKLQEMYEFLQTHEFCHCNCGNNQQNHEGTDQGGDIGDFGGLFAQNVADRVNTSALKFLLNNLNNTKVMTKTDFYA